jgi:hypothetical protein
LLQVYDQLRASRNRLSKQLSERNRDLLYMEQRLLEREQACSTFTLSHPPLCFGKLFCYPLEQLLKDIGIVKAEQMHRRILSCSILPKLDYTSFVISRGGILIICDGHPHELTVTNVSWGDGSAQDLVAAAAALEKLRKEAEAAKQLAEMSAAAHTYGVDRAADRQNAALVVTRLNQLQNVCSHTEVYCCSWAL